MLLTTLLISLLSTLSISALPTESIQKRTLDPSARFNLTATSPADLQNLPVLASRSNFFLNTRGQNAVCDTPKPQSATFYLNDGELRLYTAQHTPYTVFVDRSGMGQGALGYITRNNALSRRFETHGWALNDKNEILFDGTGLLACPGAHVGAWPAWGLRLQGFESNPNWSQCVRVVVVAKEVERAVACEYSAAG